MELHGATSPQYAEREHLKDLLATGLIEEFDLVIDGGAHVGSWSEIFAKTFKTVHAFEPSGAYESLVRNAKHWPNVICHNMALTDEMCRVESWHRKAGGKFSGCKIRKTDSGKIIGTSIDSLGLSECSVIKLDVEGSEYAALMGAKKTIKKFSPFLIIELTGHGEHFGHGDADVKKLVHKLGYEEVWQGHVDHGFKKKSPD